MALEAALAIREAGVSAVSVGDLLRERLHIPHYQRPYSWEPTTAVQLVDDVVDSMADPRRSGAPYVLGSVILHSDKGQAEPSLSGRSRNSRSATPG